MLEFFEERLRPNAIRAGGYLISQWPWTEYALYYTYLEQVGLFDRITIRTATVRTYQNNVWQRTDGEAGWYPARSSPPTAASTFPSSRVPPFTLSILSGQD